MPEAEPYNSDFYLMELAARNPSLGGRELVLEILERGPLPENHEAPRTRDSRAAFTSHELDHPDYRTPVEQSNWLHRQSQSLRALYEQGAEFKGDVLIIPAEEYELSDERETPFITTLAYALKQIPDLEQAQEFHSLAHAISGESADARMQITVFKTFYDRLKHREQREHNRTENEIIQSAIFTQTLEEMRTLAAEMRRLETQVSIDLVPAAEAHEHNVEGRLNTAARRINMQEESLRLPAGLRYEQKERLVRQTLPEIDRRLEIGIQRDDLFHAIDKTMLRPDTSAYLQKLAALTNHPADKQQERQVSREEYWESQRILLRLCEQAARDLHKTPAKHDEQEVELSAIVEQDKIDSLARRLRQQLGRNVRDEQPERAAASHLFVSLSSYNAGALRLPVSSVKVYETMTKIAAGGQLSLQTWTGRDGPEIRLSLTAREQEERSRIGAFLKNYVVTRLRDPETRALHRSPVFREAHTAILNTTTLEAMGRTAAEILRVNERRSTELRQHQNASEINPPPVVMPLTTWERNLLFSGRAPAHHTAEMRELRLSYGLSRSERTVRVKDLHAQRIAPSSSLLKMLEELQTRNTPKAIAHFQASILNEKINQESRVNLYVLSQRIPPHERTFLYEICEEKKQLLSRQPVIEQSITDEQQQQLPTNKRTVGVAPKESPAFRAYLASMGQIERRLLDETLRERGLQMSEVGSALDEKPLTITEARTLLPKALQESIRLRARNLAWRNLVPAESFVHDPLSEAVQISDTIAHLQETLQEKASLAQRARNDFVDSKWRESENALSPKILNVAGEQKQEIQRRFEPTLLASLSSTDANRWAALEQYASEKREDVYRAFELLDTQYRELETARANQQSSTPERHLSPVPPKNIITEIASQVLPNLSERLSPMMASVYQTVRENLHSKAEFVTAPSRLLDSSPDWHFDNLQEVLRYRLGNISNNLPLHTMEPLRDVPHETLPEH